MFIVDAKKPEENVSVIDKKIAVSGLTGKVSAAVVLASMLSLAACGGGGGSSTPATGGGSTGGGSTACTDIPGEPDIMGPITFTPATVNSAVPLGTITEVIMHLPVDADTGYVGVLLVNNDPDISPRPLSVGATVGVDGLVTIPSPGAQTLDIPVDVVPNPNETGNIYPSITLCTTDFNACKQTSGSGGVAVSYATIKKSTGFVLTRFKNFANGNSIIPTVAQIANPTFACIPSQALAIAPAVP